MKGMRGWTFPVGRIFGVDIRIHMFFLLLLIFSGSYAGVLGLNVARGLALGLFLLWAVAIREIARALAGAWFALKPRSLLLLPTGGLASYDLDDDDDPYPALKTPEAVKSADVATQRAQRAIAIAGPAANIIFGLILGGIMLTFAPQVDLVRMPWVTPAHLLRALVWINLLLGVVNLMPAWPLDGARIFKGFGRLKTGSTSSVGLGSIVAIFLIVAGILMPRPNMWLIFMGAFLLIASQFSDDGGSPVPSNTNDTVLMRDVMMADYTVLSASATLEDAMRHATHTLQDVFPVVRGGNLVGAVSRQNILEALEAGGNSYVQGIMTRHFQTASPTDPLMKTMRRILAGQGTQAAQLVPIVEGEAGERIVGIITPQNLHRSWGLLSQSRRIRQESDDQRERDRP
jgi:CBS domain-containing protein